MKFLDLLDEKIDYLFRRGKNADERLYDFFIRTITFFVIVLIVLCYGSFVNADGEQPSSNQEEYSEFTEGFTNSAFVSWATENDFNYNVLTSIGIMNNTSYNTDVFNTTNFANLPNDGYYTIENSITCIGIGSGGGSVNSASRYSVKYLYSDAPIMLSAADGAVIAYSTQQIGCKHTQLNSNLTMYDSWGWETSYGSEVSSSYDSNIKCYRFVVYSSPSQCCWVNCPYYSLDTSEGWQSNYDIILAYMTMPDKWVNINYEYATQFPDEVPEEVETDSNNLYLDELQVGLTSNVNGQDLLSSEVLIGVSTENNWIINHIDNYDLNIIFRFNIKDTFPSSPNDPSVDCQFSAPLRTFLDEPYQKSIIDIMKSSLFDSGSTYSNFYQYYSDLVNANNYHVVSSGTFKGIIPLITETMYEGLFGNYRIVPPENPNYTIFNFNLEVICWLTSDQSPDESGNYSKSFDFLNGVSSINSAGIFKNYNPWEGEQIPSSNPLIPSGGSSISGGSGSGNVNVTVNNNGNQKIPLNVHTKKELDDVINNYGYVQERLFSTFNELTDETKEDGYLSLLKQTLPEISNEVPVIDFFLKCAIVSIALSLIIFVLKVFLF